MGNKRTAKQEKEVQTPTVKQSAKLPADLIKIEKNLASLGFFTPSSKRIKNAKAKVLTFKRVIGSRKVEARATIVPGAIYGLPITADQDKYMALQKIVTEIKQREGEIRNPIGFTSAELLRLLRKHRDSGKNYKDVSDWLDVMSSTTIVSEGVVYFANQKRWVKDRFRVFDRAVSVGQEIEPGTVAERNYVWLSEWQLENINNNHLLPVDFDAYRQLSNHIAKALVPLLQIWLFASREQGAFEKRYDELCQTFSLSQYRWKSDIARQLRPSLDELKAHGYLKRWKIVEASDDGYKIVFWHGERFLQGRRKRLPDKGQRIEPVEENDDENARADAGVPRDLLSQLTGRGIPQEQAGEILHNLAPDQNVVDQLEYADLVIAKGGIENPVGFTIALLRKNQPLPPDFLSSRRRLQLEEERRAEDRQRLERLRAYEDYKRRMVEGHIAENNLEDEYQTRLLDKIERLRRIMPKPDEELSRFAASSLVDEIAREMPDLQTEEEFLDRQGGT